MMTMSDDGERTCPLCAEEMDLTDQQLKPCRCGYEICVWCWHHIIDLAEKEETVGRCPACRTQYDKERIVAMAASCERVVAENNIEKRHKGPKVKPKTSVEAKKHLTSVRVIQRNLVYIIGLPSHFCDESILERKEYFGQYGKVLKVSISRPANSQQISSNNTFSVYITYAREEEAVRCIQYVHNYVLEGKALRACFGTTKYCHAWLRNMTCNNPDCLYLHDVGIQEDSFTKDEIISAYTRTRIPQIASNISQRRSGSVLPPPLDDFSIAGAGVGQCQAKISSNQSIPSQVRGSPPDSAVGNSAALPTTASWGLRSPSCWPSAPCSQSPPANPKAETNNSNISLPSLVEDGKHTSAWNDEVVTTRKVPESDSSEKRSSWPNEMVLSLKASENNGLSFNKSAWHDEVVMTSKAPESRSSSINKSSLPPSSMESSKLSSSWHDYEAATSKAIEKKLQGLTNQVESFKLGSWEDYNLPIKEVLENDFGSGSSAWNDDTFNSSKQGHLSSVSDDKEDHKSAQGNNVALMNNHLPKCVERTSKASSEVSKSSNSVNGVLPTVSLGLSSMLSSKDIASASQFSSKAFPASVAKEQGDLGVQLPKQQLFSSITLKDYPVLPLDNQIPKISVSDVRMLSSHSSSGLPSNNLGSKQLSNICVNTGKKFEPLLPLLDDKVLPFNGHKEDELFSYSVDRKIFERRDMNHHTEEKFMEEGRSVSLVGGSSGLGVTEESNIVSDILSLDFDPWDDSLFSSNDLVKLLGEDAKQDGSSKLSTLRKPQSSNQSRFSFAWQENQGNLDKPLTDDMGHVEKFYSSQGAYGDGFQNGTMFNNFEGPKTVITTNLYNPSDSTTGTLRSKVSAPPGFSAPSKATPPGFSSQDRFNQAYETSYTESSFLGGPLVGGHFQSHVAGNSVDLELSDPAIMMAVGKEQMPLTLNNPALGLTPSFVNHSNTSDNDPRLHLLMEQSLSSHQNLRLPEHMGERYLPVNDLFITSQLLAQDNSTLSPFDQMSLQQPISSHFPDSQRNGWNRFHSGTDIRLGEILRNDRYGLTNYYSSNDEPKYHMPNGNLYNRAFGM